MSTNSGVDRTQPALFDADLAAWRSQPERAFDGWLASHGFGQATAVVYRAMWGKLLRWSGERGLAPLSWSAQQIGEFLDAQQLHKHHRYRYARLIERVFHHLSALQQGLHNPATQAVRARLADGENDPMAFLLPAERDCLISQLAAACAGPEAQGEYSPTQWKRARDLALLAVLLGAGLKVGQVRALGLDQFTDGLQAVRMVRPDNGRAYEAPLLAFARPALAAWLAVRASGGALGSLVFPATPDGRAMHAASVYRRIERLLGQAGVLDGRSERASPQTLRNTYGALHFDAGAGPAAVAQYLGMRDLESGWRLRAAYEAWMARSGQMTDHDAPAASA
ncbi:integrase [Cupriavidus sp. USMAA2-4]|uniref:Integrase n=1 Tax=Cupriavidus malaysiensis TaxID=367825 RepID=A0ABM6FA19_9BURK|nr:MULTISPECIES: tyrosine-type recombinase/integrase [Cupriavidus]AOY95297.1 integrase [Cupriavidus sp. USMAA2-4]AOZ01802.1 integrase [Cupriavidus sp. USMAHM13]AOZ08461.1 integrase [Cupriavidus malaysiensis]